MYFASRVKYKKMTSASEFSEERIDPRHECVQKSSLSDFSKERSDPRTRRRPITGQGNSFWVSYLIYIPLPLASRGQRKNVELQLVFRGAKRPPDAKASKNELSMDYNNHGKCQPGLIRILCVIMINKSNEDELTPKNGRRSFSWRPKRRFLPIKIVWSITQHLYSRSLSFKHPHRQSIGQFWIIWFCIPGVLRAGKHFVRIPEHRENTPVSKGLPGPLITSHNIYYVKSYIPILAPPTNC